MIATSMGRIVAAFLLAGSSGTALFFAVTHEQREEKAEMAAAAPVAAAALPAPTTQQSASAAPTEASPPLAAIESKPAEITAALPASPTTPAQDESVPAFDLARIEKTGDAVIAGRAAPGATVELLRDGNRLDRVIADASGQFVMVPSPLPAGNYELTLRAKLPDGTMMSSKQSVSVSIAEKEASPGAAPSRVASVPEIASPPSLSVAKRETDAVSQSPHALALSLEPSQPSSPPSVVRKSLTKVVYRGESLWSISRITYGAGQQYAIVYKANRDKIRDPNLIRPGQVLVLPIKHH